MGGDISEAREKHERDRIPWPANALMPFRNASATCNAVTTRTENDAATIYQSTAHTWKATMESGRTNGFTQAKVVLEGRSGEELKSIKEEWYRMLVFFFLHVYIFSSLPLAILVHSPSSHLPSGGPLTG